MRIDTFFANFSQIDHFTIQHNVLYYVPTAATLWIMFNNCHKADPATQCQFSLNVNMHAMYAGYRKTE